MSRASGVPLERAAAQRYEAARPLASPDGTIALARPAVARRLAADMNEARASGRVDGPPTIQAGELHALGLLHEIFHHLVERYEDEARPGALREALAALADERGDERAAGLLRTFASRYPGSYDTEPELVEELLLTWLANANPAAAPLRELFDDRPLAEATDYDAALETLEAFFGAQPGFGPDGQTLLELLRAPARHSPTSLAGQLRYIRDRWGSVLGGLLDRLLVALDVLAEEERALHLRFGGGAGGGFGGRVDLPSFRGLDEEPERFSDDSDWMPRLVLIAKSTHVWLDQLSRWHGREVRTLDAIPDEELDRLASWGVSGLWLIGLWERSKASERIKRMRGNPDAAASAYSLDDYRIADDLGGEAAFESLKARAWARGIRMASDMVPNHMGIDSRWVIEHPEWFISLPEPPYPGYAFSGADLSSDERVGIFLEDHYWDNTDAAVVFRRLDRWTGDSRYVYHGNDGTSFPWNDTAQLDFLRAEVREQVIRTILDVARRSPVIRFDAAMVLARRHIRRLWYPAPGAGGAIPSRAEHGSMADAEFERLMPTEFWREVVDRVAAEVPDTLLLAEAFWMLEGYFVRTLGMHRVYNSAFMHMFRDEDNAGYRRLIKETLDFDPEILKRYVNFMNNPDEKTAVEQFGKGDKYFGVATLMATLPGLPMLGHGQVEGFGEKYGMEFRRATLDEQPDRWLVERHEREIFPLLHRRGWFAGAEDFRLYDFVTDGGGVDENVLAYSNGRGPTRSLVVYHNRFASTAGRLAASVGSKSQPSQSLADALGLAGAADDALVAFRDAVGGRLEYLRTVGSLRDGLWLRLDAYQRHVFWELREVPDPAGVWRRVHDRLGGAGVASLEEALRELELEPVHAALRELLASDAVRVLLAPMEARTDDATHDDERGPEEDPGVAPEPRPPADIQPALDEIEAAVRTFLERVREATGAPADPALAARSARRILENAVPLLAGFDASAEDAEVATPLDQVAAVCWVVLSAAADAPTDVDGAAGPRAVFDGLRLGPPLAAGLRGLDLDEGEAWEVVGRVRVLLGLARPSMVPAGHPAPGLRLVQAWLADPEARRALGVNTWEGVEWLSEDGVRWTSSLALVLGLIADEDLGASWPIPADDLERQAALAGWRVDRLLENLRAGRSATPLARGGRSGQRSPEATSSVRTSETRDDPGSADDR